MKKLILLLLLMAAYGVEAQIERPGRSPKPYNAPAYNPADYLTKMETNLDALKTARNYAAYDALATRFRTIADGEKNKWIPYYHAAYAGIMAAYMTQEKFRMEDLLNQAQQCLDKALAMRPGQSELMALQGFLYQARIRVKPEQRSKEYTQKAIKAYDMARFADDKNPRPYFLIGQFLYYLPKEWGGNKANACKHFRQAKERFQTFKPKSSFSPNWGEAANTKMLKECK